MAKVTQDVTMENIRTAVRNFSGAAKQYNPAGKRNFLAMLDEDTAQAMKADGWHVKYLKAREEDDADAPFLKVNVNFENEPLPVIFLISEQTGRKTQLDESTVGLLDSSEIVNVDLLVTPYNYEFGGNAGVTAYLKKGYFTIREDALDLKYNGGGVDMRSPGDNFLESQVAGQDTPF